MTQENNNKTICSYCKWEIIPGDLSRVVIENGDDYPNETYHTACYNYNGWLMAQSKLQEQHLERSRNHYELR